MNSIYHRISVRKYEQRPVEREKILAVLKAAMQAPSARNQQPWEFYVVTDAAKIEQLSHASPYTAFAAKAPAIIVAASRTNSPVPEYINIDMSIAMENLWLETDAQGLGGTWMGIAPIEERMQAVEKIVGIPEGLRAFAIYSIGYPAESRPQQDRYDESRIHWVE